MAKKEKMQLNITVHPNDALRFRYLRVRDQKKSDAMMKDALNAYEEKYGVLPLMKKKESA